MSIIQPGRTVKIVQQTKQLCVRTSFEIRHSQSRRRFPAPTMKENTVLQNCLSSFAITFDQMWYLHNSTREICYSQRYPSKQSSLNMSLHNMSSHNLSSHNLSLHNIFHGSTCFQLFSVAVFGKDTKLGSF